MVDASDNTQTGLPKGPEKPFRRAVLRGLGIVMPPLLTIALFVWAWSLIERYVLVPLESTAQTAIIMSSRQSLDEIPFEPKVLDQESGRLVFDSRISVVNGEVGSFSYQNREYHQGGDGKWVGYFSIDYVRDRFLRRTVVLPFFLCGFLLVLYLLGKFVAAGVGRILATRFDVLIHRLPLISNVYSSVKQVTDFVFKEQELEFNRVVAIEYPRKGLWSIGFVTGESMLDIRAAANEPVLSVLMPTSPMPVTGFTISVLKSEAVDLNLTIDQAIQFIVSCGVVVPRHQQQQDTTDQISRRITAAIAQHGGGNGASGQGTRADRPTEAADDTES